MTKRALNALKGWGIGAGILATVGTIGVLTSARTAEERAMDGMYDMPVIQRNDTAMFEHQTLWDAYNMTNIPMDDIKNAILNKDTVDGYEFYLKK